MSRASVRIGTSGWQYLPFRERFYPPRLPHADLLSHYVSHLGTVEVNRTFYYFPSPDSFASWHESTPEGFKFAIKAHQSFTHDAGGLGDPAPLSEFLSRVDARVRASGRSFSARLELQPMSCGSRRF